MPTGTPCTGARVLAWRNAVVLRASRPRAGPCVPVPSGTAARRVIVEIRQQIGFISTKSEIPLEDAWPQLRWHRACLVILGGRARGDQAAGGPDVRPEPG